MWFACLFLATSLFADVSAAQLKPASSYFDICHTSDPKYNECLINILTKMRPQFIKGIPSLNVQPVEPLIIEKIEMGEGSGNFKLYQKLTNLYIYGIGDYKIESMDFDYERKRANFSISFPKMIMKGDYELNGQILILPVKGKGKCTYIFTNVLVKNEIKAELFDKNKTKYIRWKDYKITIEPGHAQSNFTNLFNGDKRLGDSTNKFLNENWSEAFNTYRQLPEKAFAEVLKTMANAVLSKFPANEIFPK